MRPILSLLLVTFALLPAAAPQAQAAPRPAITKGTPYPDARARLIRQGFDPVPIAKRGAAYTCEDHPELCRAFPEVISCTQAGGQFCNYLYRQRVDGRLWIVGSEGEEDANPVDLRRLRVHAVWPAEDDDLSETVIAKGGRRGRH